MKKNIYLLFEKLDEVILGKDVFLTPYYIAKKFNLELKIVSSNKNKSISPIYRGAEIIKKAFKSSRSILFLMGLEAKKIDNLMLFHLNKKTFYLVLVYKFFNPKGKVYVKADIDETALNKKQNFASNKIRRIVKKKIYIKAIEKIDLITVETKKIYNLITEKGIYNKDISSKLEYLPNGFDEELLEKMQIDLKKYDEKENIMITVGRIGEVQKNNELLLKSIEELDLKEWKILLIGPVNDDFKLKFKEFLFKNPLKKEKVILVGNITDKKELFQYYNRAKVFLLTSNWEGFALVFLEALRFGNYILTTDVGGAQEVTNNSEIGKVVEIENAKELRRGLEEIINGEIDLKQKMDDSITHSKQFFIWEKIINNSKIMEKIFR